MRLPGIPGILLPTLFFLAASSSLAAQPSAEDTALYKKAVTHLILLYQQSAGDQSWLYNGSQYGDYPFPFKDGHPFFYGEKPGIGSVVYDGIQYTDVLLQFDEIQDVIIMQDSTRRIQLLNDKITGFTLFNTLFVHLIKDSLSTAVVKTGFYNLLYDGKTSLLKKETKTIREDLSTQAIIRFIDFHEYYYIRKDSVYYTIGSKKKFLKLLGDRKKELQQYIRKNKLSYRNDRDNMLVKTMAYYNQLTR